MWKNLKGIPPIKAVMTAFPYSVEASDGIAAARRMMAEHDIRHLPVMRDGALAGVVTEGDLRRAFEGADETGPGRDACVRDVCRMSAYVVDLNQPLDRVLQHMADEHVDAAVVVKSGRLVGIFTATDVCRALRELLRARFPGGGDEAA